jgi:hypothetical protein
LFFFNFLTVQLSSKRLAVSSAGTVVVAPAAVTRR